MSLKQKFEHLKIPLEAIKSATNDFANNNYIGAGGFGKVYKGELLHSNQKTMVAFKRLDTKFGQGVPEFWKEIMLLSRYKHVNIVSLIGFCDDSDEKILVYEFASKRSLDLYLKHDGLTWIRRLEICIGAARGLAYLHNPPTNSQQRVLHRDIKSSNILLDENWNARISDLGLSKFGPANQQHTFLVSNACGTIGYCDPVYVETGLLTKESDVYSFGVVLFEILCGRLCIDNSNEKHRSLTGLVRRCYEQNIMSEIIYGNMKDEIKPDSLKEFITIAYQCLKRDQEERPSMIEIVKSLETALNYQKTDQEDRPSSMNEIVKSLETAFNHQASNEAEQCLTDLSQYDPFTCLSVIAPILVTKDEHTLITCIVYLTKLVARFSQEELMAQLDSFLPSLISAFSHKSADVRKNVVLCLVDIYIMLGKAFLPYLEGLNSTQLRLVKIYASSISKARTGTPNPGLLD